MLAGVARQEWNSDVSIDCKLQALALMVSSSAALSKALDDNGACRMAEFLCGDDQGDTKFVLESDAITRYASSFCEDAVTCKTSWIDTQAFVLI